MKKRKIYTAYLIVTTIFSVPTVCYLLLSVVYPTIRFVEQNKSINFDIVSAKQIAEQMSHEVSQTKQLNKYDLVLGGIEMEINKLHRGEIKVVFVENASENPYEADATRGWKNSKVICAELDTNKGMFKKFQDYGRESKLYTGIIDIDNWVIDSTDAVRIAEVFFTPYENFRYDSIFLKYKGNDNSWWVYLIDRKNDNQYLAHVDVRTGETSGYKQTNPPT